VTHLQNWHARLVLDLREADLTEHKHVYLGRKFVHFAMHKFVVLFNFTFLQKGKSLLVHRDFDTDLHAGVSRDAVLSLLRGLGYSSEAVAIEPVRGERTPQFLDNHSYAFHPA
jgi:hypothetical protein